VVTVLLVELVVFVLLDVFVLVVVVVVVVDVVVLVEVEGGVAWVVALGLWWVGLLKVMPW